MRMFVVLKQQICRVPYHHGIPSAREVYVGPELIAIFKACRGKSSACTRIVTT